MAGPWKTKGMVKNIGVLVSNIANNYQIDLSDVAKHDHDRLAIIPGIVSCILPPVFKKMWFNITNVSDTVRKVTLNVIELLEDSVSSFWFNPYITTRSYSCENKVGLVITAFTVNHNSGFSYDDFIVRVNGAEVFRGDWRDYPYSMPLKFSFNKTPVGATVQFSVPNFTSDGSRSIDVSYYTEYENEKELTGPSDNVELNCLVIGD